MTRLFRTIDRFFHARAHQDHAFVIAGLMRMAYAFLILYDRLILTMDFDFFFLSSAMPLSVSSRGMARPNLLWLAPEQAAFYWSIHVLSMICAVLLLVGIAPRIQIAALLVSLSAFWTHNNRIWDSQDNIFRLWGIYLLFLPIHRSITIWDGFGRRTKTPTTKKVEDDEAASLTWPMWPFRIWQFQLMAIYTSAGLAKLAVPEWQNGTAMLHVRSADFKVLVDMHPYFILTVKFKCLGWWTTKQVIHTTDFYGGIFNPDCIFNRMGPLMIMTYASLFLECACLLTAWIWPVATVAAMYGLHLGIELAMNMHCLEWLCMVGWLVFLVRPIKEEEKSDDPLMRSASTSAAEQEVVNEVEDDHDESMETVDVAAPPDESSADVGNTGGTKASEISTETRIVKSISLYASTFPDERSSVISGYLLKQLLRHLGTCTLIAFGLVIFLETSPLERLYGLLPETAYPYLQQAVDYQNYLVQTFTQPITAPLQLRQEGWYMYSIPPKESYRYEIVFQHANGTSSSWHSPKWEDMTWYQKKRWQRFMSLYDRLGSASMAEWDAFTRYMAQQQHQQQQHDSIASLELYQHKELPVTWPVDMVFGFFNEARQPLARYQTVLLFSLNLCADFHEQCAAWASEGYCDWPISTYLSQCRYSCDYCRQNIANLDVGSRVAVFYPVNYQYFRATVRQVKQHARRQVWLEYDFYNTDEDRYEWFDQHLLWERGLMILREEASDSVSKMVPIEPTRREEL
jgi:Vitamin K-dependent gamma-carboxylase/ShK domain-like